MPSVDSNYDKKKIVSGDVISTAIDAKKTAEAINFNLPLRQGMSNADYVASRGGINAQGYYNDVPAYQQLTANERKSVTLANGHIDTSGMLAILNKKEADYNAQMGIMTFRGNIGSSSGSITATPITPVSAITYTPPPPPVKTATPDIVLFDDEGVPVEVMEDLLFENIGGQELINIARSDTINGQPISYQPIKNISAIQQQYNPNNIVSLQQTSNRFFAGFSIKLEDKIPNEGNGSNGSNIYIDTDNGNLTIELVKLEADEQVEIQIVTNGTIYEDTIEGFTS